MTTGAPTNGCLPPPALSNRRHPAPVRRCPPARAAIGRGPSGGEPCITRRYGRPPLRDPAMGHALRSGRQAETSEALRPVAAVTVLMYDPCLQPPGSRGSWRAVTPPGRACRSARWGRSASYFHIRPGGCCPISGTTAGARHVLGCLAGARPGRFAASGGTAVIGSHSKALGRVCDLGASRSAPAVT